VFGLQWSDELLRELLSLRLAAYTNGEIRSLAQLAAPDLRDLVDANLAHAARGSPRRLLDLADLLFQICAEATNDDDPLITPAHLAEALGRLPYSLLDPVPDEHPAEISAPAPAAPADGAVISDAGVPLLRVVPSGEIWLGDQPLAGWDKITDMQRRLLEFLYTNRGRLCSKDEIIAYVWANRGKPADDDSLRKLLDRIYALLNDDPKRSRYFLRASGRLRLINTVD
jgi:Transcriptional regulatory protein, C terminal